MTQSVTAYHSSSIVHAAVERGLGLKHRMAKQTITSQTPYHTNLNSLDPKGRKAMTTILHNSAMLLRYEGDAALFH